MKSLSLKSMALPSFGILAVIVYLWAFPGHFFLDDIEIVQTNLQVYAPDLKTILTSDYWGAGENTGLFRPLTILSFALNRLLLGDGASGYLLVNLLLHILVAYSFFRLLLEFGLRPAAAWFASALFTVHPIHAEPVVELVGRSELLAALFALSALYFSRSKGRYSTLWVVLSFLGALLSKENGVVVLLLIPVVDLYLSTDSFAGVIRSRGRLLLALSLVTIMWLAYRIFVVHYGIPAPPTVDPYYIPLGTVDGPTRGLSALKLQFLYLAKELLPIHLQGMYPVKTVKPFTEWLSVEAFAIFSALLALSYAVWQGWLRRSLWGLAVICYLISFAPTSNIFFSAGFTMADRVAYFPSLWFCAGIASVGAILSAKFSRPVLIALVSIVLLGYGISGAVRAHDFSSPESLWQSDLKIDPDNELSLLMLVSHLRSEGRKEEAAKYAEQLIQIAPDFKSALNIYAWLLIDLGRPQAAIQAAQNAIALEPQGSVSASKLPLASALIGLGRYNEALATLAVVRTTDIRQPVYWELQGRIFEARGDLLGALDCYQRESGLSGGRSRDGLFRLGRIYYRLNLLQEAERALQRDLRLNPGNAEGWAYLGRVQSRIGKKSESASSWQRAVQLQPESIEYRQNLQQAGQ